MARRTVTDRQALPAPSGRTAAALDDVDRRLLAKLMRDGRSSVRALAERLHISRANAYARIERLRADGVLVGFRAVIDPERAGLGTSAYVSLAIEQNSWREVAGRLRTLSYVEHIALVAGDQDVLVMVRAPDNGALRRIVFDEMQAIPGVTGTTTWLVFEEHEGAGAPWD